MNDLGVAGVSLPVLLSRSSLGFSFAISEIYFDSSFRPLWFLAFTLPPSLLLSFLFLLLSLLILLHNRFFSLFPSFDVPLLLSSLTFLLLFSLYLLFSPFPLIPLPFLQRALNFLSNFVQLPLLHYRTPSNCLPQLLRNPSCLSLRFFPDLLLRLERLETLDELLKTYCHDFN